MTTNAPDPASLADEIKSTEMRIYELAEEIAEIGGPAAHRLRERLHALIIEEAALKRNAAEEHITPARRAQIERRPRPLPALSWSSRASCRRSERLHRGGRVTAVDP